VGVQRPYCGQLGKRSNCQAGVFLGYASDQGATLLDRRLYLLKAWGHDPAFAQRRQQQCGIPNELGLDGPASGDGEVVTMRGDPVL
jgi:SRSO17 transposase